MTSSSALKNLITTYVLTTLIFGTVETYKCISCLSGQCTDGVQTTCETSQGCFSYRQSSESFNEKGCSSSSCDPLTISASLGNNISFGYVHKCCQTDQCNQEDIKVPRIPSDSNGVTCPACYTVETVYCDYVLLSCTGAETKCIQIIGSANHKLAFFAMGCATETACNLNNLTVLNNIDVRIYCADQSSGSPPLTSITSSIL
ncbi:Protein RoBo-1, partial [Galemys pyrenaicus]